MTNQQPEMVFVTVPAKGDQPAFKISARQVMDDDGEPLVGLNYDQAACRAECLGGRLPTSDEWDRAWEVMDLGGWEWTSTPHDDHRVVRGGSFFSSEFNVRAAGRSWFSPVVRGLNFGFRVVVSP